MWRCPPIIPELTERRATRPTMRVEEPRSCALTLVIARMRLSATLKLTWAGVGAIVAHPLLTKTMSGVQSMCFIQLSFINVHKAPG